MSGVGSSPGSLRPPRSPPGAKTSPVPVMIIAARSGSELTMRTARLMPKYMAGVKAFLAAGRSITHQAIAPSRSKRSPAAPSSSDTCLSFDLGCPGHYRPLRDLSLHGREAFDELVDVGLHRLREVDPRRFAHPLVLEPRDHRDDLERDLIDVDVRPHPPLCLLVVQQRAHELPRQRVTLDEEVVQRVVVVEALGPE